MALVGNLKDLKLPNLIQINCMEKNNAKLTLEHGGQYGFLYFQSGQIVHAEFDPDTGEKALFRMLAFDEGKFKVEADIRPPVITIKSHWNNLLLEGLHQLDDIQAKEDGGFLHTVEMVMNIRGVKKAAIFTEDGEIKASNFEAGEDAVLNAFTFIETKQLEGLLGFSANGITSILEHQDRKIISYHDKHLIYLEMDAKYQVESILPFLKQVLS
jgi:hypothetical protein